jgi:hypothetical protein
MLQERKSSFARRLSRTLACVTASAFFLSTSPVRAESSAESGADISAASAWLDEATGDESQNAAGAPFDIVPIAAVARLRSAAALGAVARTSAVAEGTPLASATPAKSASAAPDDAKNPTATPASNGAAPASTSGATASPPAHDEGAHLRAVGYIAGGVGFVGLILFAVAGLGAKNAHDRLDENCRETPCDEATRDSDIQNGKLLQKAANIGLATGIAGLGLGATLVVLGGNQHDGTPSATPAGAMITYGARF